MRIYDLIFVFRSDYIQVISYRSGIFVYDYEQEQIPKTPENVLKNLIKLPEHIIKSKESKVALLTGKQQQDLMVTAWKSLVTVLLVISFQNIGNDSLNYQEL